MLLKFIQKAGFAKAILLASVAALTLAASPGAVLADSCEGETVLERILRTKLLVIGVGSYPPGVYVDPVTGSWTGFDIDFYNELAVRLDVDPAQIKASAEHDPKLEEAVNSVLSEENDDEDDDNKYGDDGELVY